jgi:uncharacterized membrane protein (UPF0127 family)
VIRNETRGTVLATAEVWATSAADRMRGLLDSPGLAEGEALVISPCTSVHMFGMAFPLDVAFVRRDGTVIRAIENLRPNRATRIYFTARHVVELPVGVLAATGTRKGDRLVWDPPS